MKDEILLVALVALAFGAVLTGMDRLFGGVRWERATVFVAGYATGRLLRGWSAWKEAR